MIQKWPFGWCKRRLELDRRMKEEYIGRNGHSVFRKEHRKEAKILVEPRISYSSIRQPIIKPSEARVKTSIQYQKRSM